MTATVSATAITLSIPYNEKLNQELRDTLPGLTFDRDHGKVWCVPPSPWHARRVLQICQRWSIYADPALRTLSERDQFDRMNYPVTGLSVDGFAPRPYQAVVVPFMDAVGGRGLICDEVGLGKTIEALVWVRRSGIRRFIVVCPAVAVLKWLAEIQRWYPEAEAQVVLTGRDPITAPVVVLSYDMMVRLQERLPRPELLIVDEVHRIRNHKTERAKAINLLSRGVPYIIGMSGTPIINRPIELYNGLHLLDPITWSWQGYANRYCFTPERGYQGAKNLKELAERLPGVMLRRFKRDVATQMPPKTRINVPLKLGGAEQQTYQLLYQGDPDTVREVFPQGKGYFTNALDHLTALRQWLEMARSERVADWAEDFLEDSDRKLVVFCGYHTTVHYLWRRLAEYGVSAITGEVNDKERNERRIRWQTSQAERVMLLTTAGSEAIDLFGENGIDASTVLFAGRDWSPAIEEQIEGRVDRAGQVYPVEAVYLTFQDTIDQDIHQLINHKRDLIRDTVTLYDTTSVFSDLMSLLRDRGYRYVE